MNPNNTIMQAEEFAQKSVSFLCLILEQINEAILVLDENGDFVFVSPNIEQTFNHPAEEILRLRNINALFGENIVNVRQTILSGERREMEIEFLKFSETPRIFHLDLKPLFLEHPYLLVICRDITEMLRMERNIKESEEKYRTLVENLAGEYFFYVRDLTGRFTYVSPSITKTLGYTQDEFTSYHRNFITDHPANRLAEEYSALTRQGVLQQSYEMELFHKNGDFHWLDISEVPIFNEQGNLTAIEGIAHDITKRKRLKENLHRFRNLLDHTSDAIYIAKSETAQYIDVNEQACRTLNYSRDELLNMTVMDVEESFHSLEDWQRHVALLKEKGSIVVEGKHRRRNGEVFDVEINAQYVSHREEDYIVAVIRDVSERKRMESALRESQERYKILFEESKDALYIVNTEGKFDTVNSAMLELFGYEKEEMIGMEAALVAYDQKERSKFTRQLNEDGFVNDYELKLMKKDGSEMECSINGIVRKREGRTIEYQGTIRDMTEKHRIQEHLQNQERLAALGQLSSGIAHDFNNILMGITGYSQLMLRNKQLPDIFREKVETILKQAQRASQLIRQMLDFGRKSVTQKRFMDFAAFLREELKLLRPVIHEDINITFLVPPEENLAVKADATQMHQALVNLAVNAADEMPHGGNLTISLATILVRPENQAAYPHLTQGDWLRLSVADDGGYIPPETMKHIFEPFFTTKGVGKGTGLGLSQVYGIVKQHDGVIDVESKKGVGTSFHVYLPKVDVVPESVSVEEDTSSPRGNGETILLVEDEPIVLDTVKRILHAINYKVIAAENGEKGLEEWRKNRDSIDMVISDVVMPVMGGLELYHALRAESPDVKVVMMSGYPLGDENRDLLSYGLVDWIQKPLSIEKLAQTIRKALQKKS